MRDNLIGLTPTGDAAVANGGHGVAVFGSDSNIIEDNTISGNARSGISLSGSTGGNWHSDGTIRGNKIGTDLTGTIAVGNGEHGITSSGSEGGYAIGGGAAGDENLISGNGRHGIRLTDPDHTVDGNLIGTNLAGDAALPNGTDASGTWAGVYVAASNVAIGATFWNQISGNIGHGVHVADPGASNVNGVTILNNSIGVGSVPAALPNTGDGVRIEARDVAVGEIGSGNLIAGNDGSGVHVLGSDVFDVRNVRIVDNDIGWEPVGYAPIGNAQSGIEIEQETTDLIVWSHEVTDNRIHANGTYGIHIEGGVPHTLLSRNLIANNGLCAIEQNDPLLTIPPPKVTVVTSTTIDGTFDEELEGSVAEVQVYGDSGLEAGEYLGSATISGTTWSLAGSFTYTFGEVRALVILTSDSTSELSETCGDGCAPASHELCDDFNDCTAEHCDAGLGCVYTDRPAGWRCEDGDECTGHLGSHAVDLVVDIDDCIHEVPLVALAQGPRDPDCTQADWVVFDDLKTQHFTPERRGVYHYAVFAHSQAKQPYLGDAFSFVPGNGLCHGGGRSVAEDSGDDLLIAKVTGAQGYTSIEYVTSLMHELGHNLRLEHGGPVESKNDKPNYQSIMNYLYEWALNPDDGSGGALPTELNFSREVLATLDETTLVEADGLLSYDARYLVRWHCPSDSPLGPNELWVARSNGDPIDWDCDGDELEVAASGDVTLDPADEALDTGVVGAQDWGSLGFAFQCDNGPGFQKAFDIDDVSDPDMSIEEAERLGLRYPIEAIDVDIVPGCAANPVLVGVPGTVEVAMLGDGVLSLDDVIPASLRFQGTYATRASREDVNADGILDLRLAFDTQALRLTQSSTEGRLTGRLNSSQRLHGKDALAPHTSLSDADEDGVADLCDQCGDTPAGVPVDDAGCP